LGGGGGGGGAGGNGYEEYREQAAKIAEKVSENAKILKDKALDWLAQFS
jgi:hypothetical protein